MLQNSAYSIKDIWSIYKEIKDWIDATNIDIPIRVISGGPGSGKSSFMKMLAAEAAQQENLQILFFPLYYLNYNSDLLDAINKRASRLPDMPDNLLSNNQKRMLLIFDGLDELAMQGKVLAQVANNFVREVDRTVRDINSRGGQVLALLSGREVVIQANDSEFRKAGQWLHVLPYLIKLAGE